jgi:3-oxoacyl-[acyl-carrier-protein] synthase II
VAITGFGVVSPIGIGREEFWKSLQDGRSGIGRISRFDCSTFSTQLAAEVKGDLSLPGTVAEIAAEDPKVGFAYASACEALAGARLGRLGDDCLVHLGVSLETFDLQKVIYHGRVDFAAVAQRSLGGQQVRFQIPLDTAPRLICEAFGRPGRMLTNCSACAAGAQAIGHSFRNVREGRFAKALCGGFDSLLNPLGIGGFQLLGALTSDNDRGATACRPFDASRNGTVLGEGAAMLVLETVGSARARDQEILAEICGYGSSLDAHSLSAPDPEGSGAVRAMRAALEDAGIEPQEISHINTHGTGTHLNDQVEAAAIREVFADAAWERIPVSATKSVTGHLIAAAGAVEVGACLLALNGGVIPHNPSLAKVGRGCELAHVTERDTRFDGEYVLTNSFGFGGQNCSLVLRKYER